MPSSRPTRAASVSRRAILSSSVASSTAPSLTASSRVSPNRRAGPGISRSSPPFAQPTVSPSANQSDIVRPSHCHSLLRMSVTSARFAAQYAPLTRL